MEFQVGSRSKKRTWGSGDRRMATTCAFLIVEASYVLFASLYKGVNSQ